MSVRWANSTSTKLERPDGHEQFFGGKLNTALTAGERYLELAGGALHRPKQPQELDPDEKRQLILVVFPVELAVLAADRRCIYCGVRFSDASEMCKRRCAWHPGAVRGDRWTCCGDPFDRSTYKQRELNGCRACDHTELPYTDLSSTVRVMHYDLAQYLGVPEACILSVFTDAPVGHAANAAARAAGLHRYCTIKRAEYNARLARTYRHRPMVGASNTTSRYSLKRLASEVGITQN